MPIMDLTFMIILLFHSGFSRKKDVYYHWENKYWDFSDIEKLTGINEYVN